MIIFWILAGGLMALALLVALAPLARPEPADDVLPQDALNLELFRQRMQELDADLATGVLDQTQYAAGKHDLERELLRDVTGDAPPVKRPSSAASRWLLGAVLALGIPASTILLYGELGEPGSIDRPLAAPQETAGQPPSLEVLVERLQTRLKENPKEVQGWLMLGRTYFATEKVDEGLKAIEQAYALAPEDTDVMLAYAEALAAASPQKRLAGKPAELIAAALAKKPDDAAARWLSGMVDFQQDQYQKAAATWRTILSGLEPGSEEARNLTRMIEEADKRTEIAAQPTPAPAAPQTSQADSQSALPQAQPQPAPASSTITVEVRLAPQIAARAAPEDTVFVLARAADGPAMPLAVKRLQVRDLPATVTLDDSMAMTPAARLSGFTTVKLGARVSKTGEAMPQSGDLQGESEPVRASDTPKVSVTIDQVRP